MSKYTLCELGRPQSQVFKSLRAAKIATKQANNAVLLDWNGAVYVKIVGGRVIKGENYRKFTRRGYTMPTPRPVAVATAVAAPVPTPAPVPVPEVPLTDEQKRELFLTKQRKWTSDNGVRPESKVRVTRIALDHEDGWNDVWTSDMDAYVGKICTVHDAYSSRIHLRNSSRQFGTYNFPYFVLEVVE